MEINDKQLSFLTELTAPLIVLGSLTYHCFQRQEGIHWDEILYCLLAQHAASDPLKASLQPDPRF